MVFGDSFLHFQKDLKVDINQAKETYEFPSKFQGLPNGVGLYFKSFKDEKFSNLLLGTQYVNNETIFAFGYWMPADLIQPDLQLVNILERFAHQFGIKIRISNDEAFFLTDYKATCYGKLDTPFQIVTIFGNENIPCDLILSYKENIVNNLNQIDVNYCFAINNNKYITWIDSIETIPIHIPAIWHSQLSEITELLDPYGNTKLKILKSKQKEPPNEVSTEKMSELLIPKVYEKRFIYIAKILQETNYPDKVIIIPEFQKNKCVFCGSSDISSEHIFPKWVRSYFSEQQIRGKALK
jgi:hypothetical protein